MFGLHSTIDRKYTHLVTNLPCRVTVRRVDGVLNRGTIPTLFHPPRTGEEARNFFSRVTPARPVALGTANNQPDVQNEIIQRKMMRCMTIPTIITCWHRHACNT